MTSNNNSLSLDSLLNESLKQERIRAINKKNARKPRKTGGNFPSEPEIADMISNLQTELEKIKKAERWIPTSINFITEEQNCRNCGETFHIPAGLFLTTKNNRTGDIRREHISTSDLTTYHRLSKINTTKKKEISFCPHCWRSYINHHVYGKDIEGRLINFLLNFHTTYRKENNEE